MQPVRPSVRSKILLSVTMPACSISTSCSTTDKSRGIRTAAIFWSHRELLLLALFISHLKLQIQRTYIHTFMTYSSKH
jgi:hypothetical protein